MVKGESILIRMDYKIVPLDRPRLDHSPLYVYIYIFFLLFETETYSFYKIYITFVDTHSNIFTAVAQKRDLYWVAGNRTWDFRTASDAVLFELRRTLEI